MLRKTKTLMKKASMIWRREVIWEGVEHRAKLVELERAALIDVERFEDEAELPRQQVGPQPREERREARVRERRHREEVPEIAGDCK